MISLELQNNRINFLNILVDNIKNLDSNIISQSIKFDLIDDNQNKKIKFQVFLNTSASLLFLCRNFFEDIFIQRGWIFINLKIDSEFHLFNLKNFVKGIINGFYS